MVDNLTCKNIDGITSHEKKTMLDVVSKLSEVVEAPIDYQTDIKAAHRVPTKTNLELNPL